MRSLVKHGIEAKIYLIKNQRVMIDTDLAKLYGVKTSNLNKAVKRNIERFPDDFMFQLSNEEILRFQFGTANSKRRFNPYAFTENGVAMLSSVLRSKTAIQINIQIMRAFTRLKHAIKDSSSLSKRVDKLEKGTTKLFKITFDRLNRLEGGLPILPIKRKRIGIKE